jgi:autotransporter-associated beta strand protein
MNRSIVVSIAHQLRAWQRFGLALAVLGLTAPAAFGQATWTSATSGQWSDTAKWSTGIVPGDGNTTAALLDASGSYTVTYDTAMTGRLGSLTLTNVTGSTTTLDVNTTDFSISTGSLTNATVNIPSGGSVSNTGALTSTAGAKMVISGGSYTGGVNFGNSSFAASILVEMSSGSFSLNGSNGNNFGRFNLTGGSVAVAGGIYDQVFPSTISAGTYTNTSSNPFQIRGGTFTVTSTGVFSVNRLSLNGQGQNLQVDGGTVTVTGDRFHFGSNNFTGGTRNTFGTQTGGSVSMAHANGLVLGQASGTGQSGSLNRYQLSGGTLTLEKITLAEAGYVSAGTNRFEMTGGTLNLGSGGIVIGDGVGTKQIWLSGGVIGASADWSSSADVSLLTGTGTGIATFRAADAQGVAKTITLSGIVTGAGALTKTGGGVLELTAANDFSGGTTVTAGRLLLSGSGSINDSSGITLDGGELRQSSSVSFSPTIAFGAGGGTISGSGTIGSAVTAGTGVTLAPGNSPGTQEYAAGLVWNPGGTYQWELNALTGTPGVTWDLIDVSGGVLDLSGLSSGGQFTLDLTTLGGDDLPGPLQTAYAGGNLTFAIASFSSLSVPGGFSTAAGSDLTDLFSFNSLANWQGPQPALGDISVTVNSTGDGLDLVIVPEPAGWLLVGAGLAAAWWRRRQPGSSPGG